MKHLEIKKYQKLFLLQLHMAVDVLIAYRKDLVFALGSTIGYIFVYLVFLHFLLNRVHAIAGWNFDQMLVLTGVSQLWVSFYFMYLFNNASNLVKNIRNGTFDFLLLKPANLQFLIHNSIDLPSLFIGIEGIVMFVYAFYDMHTSPSFLHSMIFLFVFFISCYLAFNVQRIINVTYILFPANSTFYYFLADVFQLATYPYEIYTKVMFVLFSLGVPIVIFLNVPARALLGTLSWQLFFYTLGIAFFFWGIAHVLWQKALMHYSSNGG